VANGLIALGKRFFLGGWCASGRARPSAHRSYKNETSSPSSQKGESAGKYFENVDRGRRRHEEKSMAKSKRGSSENLFSISGASEALGRSRRTITRALADVQADAVRSGLKLWRMQKIIAAVNTRTAAPILETVQQGSQVLTGLAAQTAIAFEAYDEAQAKMEGLKSVEARRAFARAELGPVCREAISLMRQRDTESGLHEEHVSLRGDRIYALMVRAIEIPCDMTLSEAWGVLDQGGNEEDEAA
jgi:hypothetical protein